MTKRSYYTEEVGEIFARHLDKVMDTKQSILFTANGIGLTQKSLRVMVYNGCAYAADHLGKKEAWDKCAVEKTRDGVQLTYLGNKVKRSTANKALQLKVEEREGIFGLIEELINGPSKRKLAIDIESRYNKRLIDENLKKLDPEQFIYAFNNNKLILVKK